jgi:fructoselysine 6-phosphate deglycase
MEIDAFIQKAVSSALFTAPVLGDDLERFLKEEGARITDLAKQAIDEKVSHIFWVGAGNSRVNLLSGKELMNRFTDIPGDCFTSYEFIWNNPVLLNKKSWVFLASYSGATEDTVAALRFAKQKGAKTISFVNQLDSLMGRESDVTIAYKSKALFSLPLAAAYLFVLQMAKLNGNKEAEKIIADLYRLPNILRKQYIDEKDKAIKTSKYFGEQEMIYTLASGPLIGLGYKFGLTVFMENIRVNGSFMEATEFRHGPAEMLDRHKPAFIVLLGTDDSRALVQRVIDLLKTQDVPLIVYDVAEYGDFHPLLAPFLLKIPLQWFSILSANLRGITDLDERVFMGRGLMGKGKGVTWP